MELIICKSDENPQIYHLVYESTIMTIEDTSHNIMVNWKRVLHDDVTHIPNILCSCPASRSLPFSRLDFNSDFERSIHFYDVRDSRNFPPPHHCFSKAFKHNPSHEPLANKFTHQLIENNMWFGRSDGKRRFTRWYESSSLRDRMTHSFDDQTIIWANFATHTGNNGLSRAVPKRGWRLIKRHRMRSTKGLPSVVLFVWRHPIMNTFSHTSYGTQWDTLSTNTTEWYFECDNVKLMRDWEIIRFCAGGVDVCFGTQDEFQFRLRDRTCFCTLNTFLDLIEYRFVIWYNEGYIPPNWKFITGKWIYYI